MRVLLTQDPFAHRSTNWLTAGTWPASWIGPAKSELPAVWECRCAFNADTAEKVRIHVSADERYILWLDGVQQGRGPERGDPAHWYFDTYELDLAPGAHVIQARIWNLGAAAPRSQMSLGPGFICTPDPDRKDWLERIGTGQAKWEVQVLPGWSFEKPFPNDAFSIGYNSVLKTQPPGNWQPARTLAAGAVAGEKNRHPEMRLLRPAILPAQKEEVWTGGKVRHVEAGEGPKSRQVLGTSHLAAEVAQWGGMTSGKAVEVPPQTQRRILIDLEDYVCAFTQLKTSGGLGSSVRVQWAESLFEDGQFQRKGNRSAIEGKYFFGVGERLELTNSAPYYFQPPLWRAGRYLEVQIRTAAEPLQLQLELAATGYPLKTIGHVEVGAPWDTLVKQCERTVARSCHDAFTDGPFYEQMMWAGDCLQNALTMFVMAPDAKPALKALELFAASRAPEGHHGGLPAARWPARDRLHIAPYSLYWIALLREYAFWRDDLESVRRLLPTARAILFGYESFLTVDGILGAPPGWNFIDWVPNWNSGIPPQAESKPSGVLNWQFVWTYQLVAELETSCGEKELAALWNRKAKVLAGKLKERFWRADKGLYSDTLEGQSFSEHAQVFALLSGVLSAAEQAALGKSLVDPKQKLSRATVSFSHHLFETYRQLGEAPALLKRLEAWQQFTANGLLTTPEAPEPSRSDCHAWSAHPLFHLHATVAGIRPAGPGFSAIRIKPLWAEITSLAVTTPHPKGQIHMLIEKQGTGFRGRVISPAGVPCTIVLPNREIQATRETTEFTV